jgi:hypothetical protein
MKKLTADHLARPEVTIVLTAHRKPCLVDALNSILVQTRLRDVEVLVIDSGQWFDPATGETLDDPTSIAMARIHERFLGLHPFTWAFTEEPPDLIRAKCPIGWVTNEVIRAGWVRGRYMCTFYDDDVYEPEFVARMAGHLDDHPDDAAVWCSQNLVRLDRDGTEQLIGVRPAIAPKRPGEFDCQVDGAQVMWRTELLDKIGDPWLPEDPADAVCRHSDGIFLEKLARAAETAGSPVIHGIPDVLCSHRFTQWSAYTPIDRL